MTNLTKALHCGDHFSLHPARATLCVLPCFLNNCSNSRPFIFIHRFAYCYLAAFLAAMSSSETVVTLQAHHSD